jgi:Zn-dependent protease/CBS domain-containing protein
MRDTFRLGRIAGVPVGVHWGVLAIAALLTLGLGASQLPDAAPGYPAALYWLAGAVTALAFLASVLAHEVSHAVVARREGVPVEGITLWLFGGVARLESESPSPAADIRIAGAGPLVSIVVGVVGLAVGAALDAGGAPRLLVETLRWLGGINLVLAAFNLVPAAPLDGGRLLRAALWAWRGDRQWAALAAARAGRVFAILLVGFGAAELFAGAGVAGIWTMLVGWFLLQAADAEAQFAVVHDALGGVRVGDVMTPSPVTGPAWLTVDDFVTQVVLHHRCSAFPVVDADGDVVGLVTLRGLRRVPAHRRATTTIREIAAPLADVPTATADEPLVDVLQRAQPSAAEGRVLVVDPLGHTVVGIVSPTDIAGVLERSALSRPPSTRPPATP